MKLIQSPIDFDRALQADRAILLICFEWSQNAGTVRETFERWEREGNEEIGDLRFETYQLVPDQHPYTWKWVGKYATGNEEVEHFTGAILWLRKGSIVGRMPNAVAPSSRDLTRMTRQCFGANETTSAGGLVDNELLEILCCPETHQEVRLAEPALVENLNQQIATGRVQNRSGRPVQEKIDGGLVRSDGKCLYPIRQNIPIMLVDEAIAI
ncbi:MAG: hypothetical protein JWQ71_2838 [Pedosphaera sp.]|nr:hypothetical protein [Pedosphaera sp.]